FRQPEKNFVAPRNQAEEVLAGIWCQLLHLKRVGVNDNFFELGGHSLLATQVISRVRNAFGVELPLQALFEEPTLEEFAEQLKQARVVQTGSRPVAPRLRDPCSGARLCEMQRDNQSEGEVALSFGQERLWFLEQLEPGLAVYNVPIGIVLQGKLDISALERSLNTQNNQNGHV